MVFQDSFTKSIDDYKTKLDEIKKLEENIKNELILKFLSKKTSKEEKSICKIIRFSELSSVCWSPEYYNTDSQLCRIVDIIEASRDIKEAKNKLERLRLEKKIMEKNYKVYLNEKTLEIIDEVLEEIKNL